MRKNKLRNQILWIGLLTLVLTMLASLLFPLVGERSARRETVLRDMTRIWGAPQVIAGPIGFADETAIELTRLAVEGDLKTSMRRKGIYKFPMYAAKLSFTGQLRSAGAKKILMKSRSRLRFESASLGGIPLYFAESLENGIFTYKAPVTGLSYNTRLELRIASEGLQSMSLLPVAAETELRLKSDWNDPGFFGDFLPLEYETGKPGFTALWRISGAQTRKWSEIFMTGEKSERNYETPQPTGAFGVAFYQPVDIYQATERSVKYAILFITLTLMTLFMFEVLSEAAIHPMQYFLAGSGLVIFYLLLLALAEYLGFTPAYAAAATANIALLTRYGASFLAGTAQTVTFSFVITMLYTLLYVILQLEEAALLSGSVTLFVVLALTMYLTRKINWYQVGEAR